MNIQHSIASKELLLIFTRNTELGKVKKRLAADIGPEAALKIYKRLLSHTAEITRDLPVEKWVCYSDAIIEEDIWDGHFIKKLQQGRDLGERMEHAFLNGFKAGFSSIIIIGSDLFDISQDDLYKAFRSLVQAEAVIGPATDGGYYLLGLKSLPSNIFRNKTWSSNTVLQATLQDLNNFNLIKMEVRNDIDELKDLEQFPNLMKTIKI